MNENVEAFLYHAGVKGMKWGVRKKQAPSKLNINKSDTTPTKKVKNDYNNLSSKEFLRTHGVSKARYAKRVEKTGGDPFAARNPKSVQRDAKLTEKINKRVGGTQAPVYDVKGNVVNKKTVGENIPSARKQKKIARADKKFEKAADNPKTTLKVYNAAAGSMNKTEINRINNKSEYKNQDFTKDSPLRRKYYKEYQDTFIKNLEKAASDLGTNASGTKKYTIVVSPDNSSWSIGVKELKQASFEPVFVVKLNKDFKGRIASLEIVEKKPLIQSSGEVFVENSILHAGVKGMKWGVRRTSKSKAKTAKQPGKKTNTKKVNVKDLSDAELKAVVNRMNLEKQYRDLVSGEKAVNTTKIGKDAANDILKSVVKAPFDVAITVGKSQVKRSIEKKLGL